jgi:hypothetical protein
MKRDDALWKGILEDLFDDFLRFFIPDADEIFDMNRPFEFLDKELEQLFPIDQDEFHPKYVDKLVKVFTKNGEEQWILVHIEVQGSRDKEFGQRMFTYFYRILDKYQRPITAFAIFTDGNKSFKPSYFETEYLGTKVRYDFNSYKVSEQNPETLNESNNPFAMVILTVQTALLKGKVKKEELFELKIDLAKRLLLKKIPKDKIRGLMNFLKLYVRFGEDKLTTKFEEQIRIITDKSEKTMGIEEFVIDRATRIGLKRGIEKGEKKGEKIGEKKGIEITTYEKNVTFVKSLLAKTNFPDEQIADIANVTIEFVRKVKGQS